MNISTQAFILLSIPFIALTFAQLQNPQWSVPELTTHRELPPLTKPSTSSTTGRQNAVDTLTQSFTLESLQSIALGAQKFGFKLLNALSQKAQQTDRDIMISPFSVWSLLVLLLEGANGESYNQLRKTLNINVDDQILRDVYRTWSSNLNIKTKTVEVASLQALYNDKLTPIMTDYKNIAEFSYGAQINMVDFSNPNTYDIINREANKSTRGLIQYTVVPQDLVNAKLFMLSSLFFKGQWRFPFNASNTHPEPFYTEDDVEMGTVQMMMQENNFVYSSKVNGLDGYVLELPYGDLGRLSMIIILPKHGFTLQHVVENLDRLGLQPILEKLAASKKSDDELVEVRMPKFTTATDLKLNRILYDMGIIDIFHQDHANLTRMARDMFVNLCVHSTKIIVDEEGTTAAAVTAAVLINKSTPPKFILNKPFQYLIVDKSTGLLLFAGQVRNPFKNN